MTRDETPRDRLAARLILVVGFAFVFAVYYWAALRSPYIPRNIRTDLDALEKRVKALEDRR